ncbi:hypothetical protein F8M41_014903 [Gigaspora margarita]|uniref:Uncharacterized protein n=1 Tax=Gigaspora margarita TaxID=4874 RepID=A0A8H4ARC3_GIGMA|nr:hypothetical protein F8M41_014903 [Gigaspora margarita]
MHRIKPFYFLAKNICLGLGSVGGIIGLGGVIVISRGGGGGIITRGGAIVGLEGSAIVNTHFSYLNTRKNHDK